MEGHEFNFEGGGFLTQMGASWFTSYSYFYLVDRSHNNWRKRKSRPTELYWQTTKYHLFWLRQIIDMNENKLSTNKIELTGKQVKELALKALAKYLYLINNNLINNGIIKYD